MAWCERSFVARLSIRGHCGQLFWMAMRRRMIFRSALNVDSIAFGRCRGRLIPRLLWLSSPEFVDDWKWASRCPESQR